MKTPAAVRVLSILLLGACPARPGLAASFSAELVDTTAGQTQTGTFSFQNKSYRYELSKNGQTIIVMVDGQTGVMRLLMPAGKVYYEAGPNEDLAHLADPFGGYAFFSRTKEVQAEGKEPVGGVMCTKQVVSGGGQVYLTAWLSEEFGFPLKVEIPVYQHTVELRNIKPGPQDAALFALPADYTLQVMERVPVPKWAKDVAGAPVLTQPFEKTLKEGEMIRLRPQAGRKIRLEATNPGKETSAFCSGKFKDGKPLEDVSMSTMNLDEGQSASVTYET
jgi:outer membrane lipoprotein-sorting protein